MLEALAAMTGETKVLWMVKKTVQMHSFSAEGSWITRQVSEESDIQHTYVKDSRLGYQLFLDDLSIYWNYKSDFACSKLYF